ncbi:MAG: CoA transferase [Sphingomonadales bacterium]|nr:CoA transferase [Sphingomonadales bacterium]
MTKPLDGIRVLDFTSVVSGPVCTQVLAALGADVIKVEPLAGDPLRSTRSPLIETISGLYMQVNRGKRSIALDLRDAEVLAACLKLAEQSDVIVENFRPGVMDRLGLGYEAIRALRGDIIYASINGFGESGPWAGMRAYDSMIQALGGFMYKQGENGTPRLIQCAVADKITGRAAAEGVLSALFARERGQGGRRISVAMLDAYINFMLQDTMAGHSFLDHEAPASQIDAHLSFQTNDGWISFLFLGIGEYHAFFDACGRPDLAADPRYETRDTLLTNFAAWRDEVSVLLAGISTEAIMRECRRLQLPVAPVLTFDEMVSFEQVEHNRTFSEVDMGGSVGRLRLLNPPWRFSEGSPDLEAVPARLGEDTAAVLGSAGLDEQAIAALIARRAAAAC